MSFDAPTTDELALVYSSWCESFKKSPWAGCIRNDQYQMVQHATIQGLLARGAKITVSLAPQIPDIFEGRRVMAWCCFEPAIETMHYLYVKSDYRKKGVGKALLSEVASKWFRPTYTHRTRGSALLPKKWRWDPTPSRVLSVATKP